MARPGFFAKNLVDSALGPVLVAGEAGFVLARAAAGLADATVRSDVLHLKQLRAWFGRPLWDMEPADADAYFGTVLRGAAKVTRLARSLELLLVLPDGSKSLIPAAWADLAEGDATAGSDAARAATLGRLGICWPRAPWFPLFAPATRTSRSRLHGSHRPRRTPVRPVQLSLVPDQVPAPPVMLIAQLPHVHVTAAVTPAGAVAAAGRG